MLVGSEMYENKKTYLSINGTYNQKIEKVGMTVLYSTAKKPVITCAKEGG